MRVRGQLKLMRDLGGSVEPHGQALFVADLVRTNYIGGRKTR